MVLWQLSVMRTQRRAPAIHKRWSARMQQRRHFRQTEPLEKRLTDEAVRLRKEARGTPPGIERERLMRRA